MKIYEVAFDHRLPPGLPIIVRIDGNSFHQLTAQLALERPYDPRFIDGMSAAALHALRYFEPAVFGYVQSDEINILLRPARKGVPFLGNRIQKLVSIAAARATFAFNRSLNESGIPIDAVEFDARAFTLPPDKVADYFVWRQEDAFKNCVGTVLHWSLIKKRDSPAQAHAYTKGKSLSAQQEILFGELGININDVATHLRRGVAFYREGEWIEDRAMPRLTQSPRFVTQRLPAHLL